MKITKFAPSRAAGEKVMYFVMGYGGMGSAPFPIHRPRSYSFRFKHFYHWDDFSWLFRFDAKPKRPRRDEILMLTGDLILDFSRHMI
jgi:hypothetical protein